jgi:tRNA modification GTPase
VILLVYDGSEPLGEQDRRVSTELRALGFGLHSSEDQITTSYRRPVVIVVNKADQEQYIEQTDLEADWPQSPIVTLSTLTGEGLSQLEETLAELVQAGKGLHNESVLVTSARHQEALRRAAEHLLAAHSSLTQPLPLDFVSIDLRAAYSVLGEVTGETASDDLLDKIFSEFCIGK